MEAAGRLGWRATVPEGASVTVEQRVGAWLLAFFPVWISGVDGVVKGRQVFKVALSLALVSIFYYTTPLYDGVGEAPMSSFMTVVAVFEYTVGGSVYKSFNRAVATASAGVLALGVHWVADKTGEYKAYIVTGSLFLLAAAATFSRFIPTVKARFRYDVVTISIITYTELVAGSGYLVDELVAVVQQRFTTVAVGIVTSLAVAVFVRPVWAGQELHLLTTVNMKKLAAALEGCVEDYFAAQPQARFDWHRCVLNSKSSEDTLANLARWEPAHGRFSFRDPNYEQYAKVGDAMRACACCVDAIGSCASAEARAPEHVNRLGRDACTRVGARCAQVLREASRSVATMTASSRALDLAVADMNTVVHELQGDMRSLPSPVDDAISTVGFLLVEIAVRVQGVVDAVNELATLAC